jgi:peptide/nickel transport system ATP-binding protein
MGPSVSEDATLTEDAALSGAAVSRAAAAVASVGDLHVTFRRNGRDVLALRGVSLTIAPR